MCKVESNWRFTTIMQAGRGDGRHGGIRSGEQEHALLPQLLVIRAKAGSGGNRRWERQQLISILLIMKIFFKSFVLNYILGINLVIQKGGILYSV